jgi:hypothetical protein
VRARLIASSEAVRCGDLGSAADAARRVLARATRIGYLPFMCWARLQLGTIAQRAGRSSDARSDLEAALELALDLSLPHYVSFAEALLAGVAVWTGDGDGARRWYTDALETAGAAGAPWFAAWPGSRSRRGPRRRRGDRRGGRSARRRRGVG